jgi:hypothetical protein
MTGSIASERGSLMHDHKDHHVSYQWMILRTLNARRHSTCGDTPPPCLHTGCTDLAEIVACWHTLSADVRRRIMELARRG